MKDLASLLKAKYGSETKRGKRAQIKNDILVRKDEILAELGKGWSMRAIWEVLQETRAITCTYKTFAGHVRHLQAQGPASAITPKKEKKTFTWDSTTPDKEELI
jgi:hypothetical protein